MLTTLPVCLVEEIGFEGLEGITIEGLWKRVSGRMKLPLPLNQRLKDETWTFLLNAKCFTFHLLPTEREPLIVYERMEYVDNNTTSNEAETCPYNVYKYNPISTDTVRGSCENFDTREALSKSDVAEMTIDTVEKKYGCRFIIVASQNIRDNLLIPRGFSPDFEMSISIYCILERLGRARYNGELNQGKYSLSDICGDPVTAYSYKKKLKRHDLIECQVFHQNIDGTNQFSQLFHLPRFFSKYKSRVMLVMERIIDALKSKPNCMAEYQEIRGMFDENTASTLRRLTKSAIFQKCIINDARFPYRAMYPNATEKQWKMKNGGAERSLHVLQLRDPNMDLDEVWAKENMTDDDEEASPQQRGFLDVSHEVLEIPLLHQVYEYIGSRKSDGASEVEVGQYFGQNKLSVRAIIKKLVDTKLIGFYTTTNQRQSVRRYHWTAHRTKIEEPDLDIDSGPSNQEPSSSVTMDISFADGETAESESVSEHIDYVFEPTDPFGDGTSDDEQQKVIANKVSMKITEIDKTDYCSRSKRRPLIDIMMSDRSRERLVFMQREIRSRVLYGDPAILYAAVVQDEASRGLTDRLCRKTFSRLLTYLRQKQLIRLWRVEFQYQTKFRCFLYVGNKESDIKIPLMKSYLEQAKSKFIMSIIDERHRMELKKEKRGIIKVEKILPDDDGTEHAEENDVKTEIPSANKLQRKTKRVQCSLNKSSHYGINPKFVRLRTLHEFLYYLVYGHSETELTDQETLVERFRQNAFNTDDIETMPTIWSEDINWKMFVPPLIRHDGFPNGWCLVSDCVFRMPLSVFIRVVNYAYKIRGLDELLTHPIKKHFLLHDLPIGVQQSLFMGRKYIASISYQLQRLGGLGLVQVGPHRPAKDQAYYYVNRSGVLYDTTSSDQGLHYVSDKEYPATVYNFDSLDKVTTYWYDMYSICMNTKLNKRSLGDGTTPAEKIFPDRLIDCQRPILPHQAYELDVPNLPGDQRGAAGLDSCYFSHLERNWSFVPSNFKKKQKTPRFASEEAAAAAAAAEPLSCGRLVRMVAEGVTKRSRLAIKTVPLHKLKTAVVRRRVSVVRKKKTTSAIVRPKERKRTKYDDIDKIALQNMRKLRVDWGDDEDNFLLLCRVASMYLNPNNRIVMPPQVIRDLIHWKCNSLNKTSLACRRRVTYIMKHLPNSRQIVNRLMMCLNEIKQNAMLEQRYGNNFINRLKKVYPDDKDFGEAFRVHFVSLVHTLSHQFYNLTNTFESNWLILPNSISEFRARFIEKVDTIYDPDAIRYDRVESIEDISVATIITLIHSTMCCCYDKTSFSLQLYEIYKDFPEMLLAKAMARVRTDQLISHNKITTGSTKACNRCLPLSSKMYHLSVTYQQQMTTKINYDVYDDTLGILTDVFGDGIRAGEKYTIGQVNSGACFLISELTRFDDFDILIDIPNRILLLDPSKPSTDEAIRGLRDRFHEIFHYIPKVDLGEEDDFEFAQPLADARDEDESFVSFDAKKFAKKLEELPANVLHIFCIIELFGTTKPLTEITGNADDICSLDCIRSTTNPYDGIMNRLVAKRDVWNRLNADQQTKVALAESVTIDETNIVAVYSRILLQGSSPNDQQHAEHWNGFKQLVDIVDAVFVENDKKMIDEDYEAEYSYDSRSNVKQRMYDGAQINEKIHKFHDFLNVNTCKLSLVPKDGAAIDIVGLSRKRDAMLEAIVRDCNWSSSNRVKDFSEIFQNDEILSGQQQAVDEIYEFIEEYGEIGATAAVLRDKFVNKTFVEHVMHVLNKAKLVLRTGVGDITFVHWKYINPWIVNTYHLKRLDRESLLPIAIDHLKISDESSAKRKASTDSLVNRSPKKQKADSIESEPSMSDQPSPDKQDVDDDSMEHAEVTVKAVLIQTVPESKDPKNTIEYGEKIEPKCTPQTKKTFPLKMAPWIRVNGSINRRVLDKYAGTVLLHCIENVGTTLHSLCARFQYLYPVHIRELIQYLEEFGCVTQATISNPKPVTLFSEYDGIELGPTSILDDFKSVYVEPTLDATTKMTIFIGTKKYKEDFI